VGALAGAVPAAFVLLGMVAATSSGTARGWTWHQVWVLAIGLVVTGGAVGLGFVGFIGWLHDEG
jgi:hypothetical protein